MRRWVFAAVVLSGVLLAAGTAAGQPAGWELVWADEFDQPDGSAPDSSKWGYDTGGSGWGNNELQYYTNRTQNARIEGGHLVIETRAENFGGRNHTSARLLTQGKASWTYGRMEARIRVPGGRGIWPAFWLLGNGIDSVGWPHCGEIDIMENIGSQPGTVHGTVHGPGYSGANGIGGSHSPGVALADDFHVYAVEWEENRIRWFIDGHPYFTLTPASLPAGRPWAFDQAHFLILNVAVGGNWPGSPDASTVFPQRMTVDYVRVYQAAAEDAPETRVTVDPGENWLGYVNVSDLPADGGGYRFGAPWVASDLKAAFTGDTLSLFPNTIADSSGYWYVGGGGSGRPGNKIMSANLYVEKTGNLSGRTVVFSGKVIADSLTDAHRSVAFIKDFAPDYSSFQRVAAPLVDGIFQIRLDTNPAPGRHVQYGFETTGVNVWATDAAPFGSVSVTATGASFADWMAGFDFSNFVEPDLGETGDPDGDGRNNLAEFAFDGDPARAGGSGKVRSRVENVDGEDFLLLTLPVIDGAVFGGAPAITAAAGELSYVIEGSNDLVAFDQEVLEVLPARPDGMPDPSPGWSYRSFRLAHSVHGPEIRTAAGFLRAGVIQKP